MILVILTALTAACVAGKLDNDYLPPLSASSLALGGVGSNRGNGGNSGNDGKHLVNDYLPPISASPSLVLGGIGSNDGHSGNGGSSGNGSNGGTRQDEQGNYSLQGIDGKTYTVSSAAIEEAYKNLNRYLQVSFPPTSTAHPPPISYPPFTPFFINLEKTEAANQSIKDSAYDLSSFIAQKYNNDWTNSVGRPTTHPGDITSYGSDVYQSSKVGRPDDLDSSQKQSVSGFRQSYYDQTNFRLGNIMTKFNSTGVETSPLNSPFLNSGPSNSHFPPSRNILPPTQNTQGHSNPQDSGLITGSDFNAFLIKLGEDLQKAYINKQQGNNDPYYNSLPSGPFILYYNNRQPNYPIYPPLQSYSPYNGQQVALNPFTYQSGQFGSKPSTKFGQSGQPATLGSTNAYYGNLPFGQNQGQFGQSFAGQYPYYSQLPSQQYQGRIGKGISPDSQGPKDSSSLILAALLQTKGKSDQGEADAFGDTVRLISLLQSIYSTTKTK